MDDDGSEMLYDGDWVVQRPSDGLGDKTALQKIDKWSRKLHVSRKTGNKIIEDDGSIAKLIGEEMKNDDRY